MNNRDDELMNAIDNLPPEVLKQMTLKAIKEGRMPPPDGYDDDDEPLWQMETIAAFYGLDEKESRRSIADFELHHGKPLPRVNGAIHRVN